MRIVKLAAGLAVGYVLGSRAGREKYEQIAATARKVGAHPNVVQAQEKAKSLVGTGTSDTDAGTSAATRDTADTTDTDQADALDAGPARRKRTPRSTGSEVTGTPAR